MNATLVLALVLLVLSSSHRHRGATLPPLLDFIPADEPLEFIP